VRDIRARREQLLAWIAGEQPDVVCLQEIKASLEQIPEDVVEIPGYWCDWHGERGYSGVALLVRKEIEPQRPTVSHPGFDFECRISVAKVAGVEVASVYVPNGGKDFDAKLRFFRDLIQHVKEAHAAGKNLAVCGDLNIAHTERDVHASERKTHAIGQLPEERALFDQLLDQKLVDVARRLHPDDDELYTWWPPWRSMRQRNRGWRIDYCLASAHLGAQATRSVSHREVGTSDHAPVVTVFDR
jgi:exodeoxyribonuclease-3